MLKDQIIIKKKLLFLFICTALMLTFLFSYFTLPASAATGKQEDYSKVILGGMPFGVKFTTEGVMVIGFSDIDGLSKSQNPAYLAGIRAKDVILKINGQALLSAEDLTKTVENCGGNEISLTYKRGDNERTVKLTPVYSASEKKYKTGIWVKDSGAGIGTVTYIIPDTNEFGGLGHGICDNETGDLIKMSSGDVMSVNIHAVKKGISGCPGELKGHFETRQIGTLYSNTDCGVFGKLTVLPKIYGDRVAVGSRDEVREGEAYIYCTLEDGIRESYKAEISAINRNADGSKCFAVKITDPVLIEKTGGIVQGMFLCYNKDNTENADKIRFFSVLPIFIDHEIGKC